MSFYIDTTFQKAIGHHQNGELQDAERLYRVILQEQPNHAETNHNLGILAVQVGQIVAALPHLRMALEASPHVHQHWMSFVDTLIRVGQPDTAQKVLIQGLQQGLPDYVNAHYNLGITFYEQRRYSDAIASYHRALEIEPEHVKTLNNLGEALSALGASDEAIACFEKALENKPDYLNAYHNLLLRMQYSILPTQREVFARHTGFAETFEAPLKASWHCPSNTRTFDKRLKIGYVSADFRNHAVATFIEPVLANHDKSAFEIFCYFNDSRQDKVTERIQIYVDHWFCCLGISDEELAERIRSDGIDILIDLSGHTAGNRLLTFAHKPAPVQLTYLGYPGTTGLSAMDYRITDLYADPHGSEQYYSEKLLRLPNSLCCFRPVIDMPEIMPLPALVNEFITFGSFNNSSKIDQSTISLWTEILIALPSSRLLMTTTPEGERRESIAKKFEDAGVARNRITFRETVPSHEFHQLFQLADIALDPLLITGGTTTCESLWMGVPVIVLVGQRFIHRVGYSFLSSAGLSHFGALTKEEYVRIALETAADIPRLAKLRDSMRAQITASPLMDQARFTCHFEKALRDAWKNWCNTTN
ncbi:MAG: tetratricopeptide repeat protein [Undibacterium sp.]|uniref:O-linked N-acetylglucosamine transferase, SPINDLY family protein n=1 Tax=Undibacterium sp. TaxID=1914977 RepID=UPI002727412B|nr:glycosyltransferase family 41 protein [Undibacterium sp.]MDO8653799.1 tetratricopeptide repeat protein [Undibacterium sp.]